MRRVARKRYTLDEPSPAFARSCFRSFCSSRTSASDITGASAAAAASPPSSSPPSALPAAALAAAAPSSSPPSSTSAVRLRACPFGARFLKLTDGAGGGASSGAVGAAAGAAAGVGSGSGAFFPFAGDALLPPVERFLGAIPILCGGRWDDGESHVTRAWHDEVMMCDATLMTSGTSKETVSVTSEYMYRKGTGKEATSDLLTCCPCFLLRHSVRPI